MLATGRSPKPTMTSPSCKPARRAARLDGLHLDAALDRQAMETHQAARQRDVLTADAEVAAPYFAILHQPSGDELGRVYGGREAECLRGRNDRRLDPDDLATRRDQRPAGVAGVQ